jgi:hypothetical protein
MKPDLYTKAVLTVTAAALVALAANQYINPKATAQAQGAAGELKFSDGNPGVVTFFDGRTGEVVEYLPSGQVSRKWRLTKVGQPLLVEK